MERLEAAVPRTRTDAFGTAGAVLGVLATLYVLFFWRVTVRTGTSEAVSTEDGGVVDRTAESTEVVYEGVLSMYRAGAPSDPALLLWPTLVAVAAVVGGVAAWKRHRAGLWASALALTATTLLGLFTFGLLVAPAAAAMLLAALSVQSDDRGGPGTAESDGGSSPRSGGGTLSLLVRKDVLALFAVLAGPMLVIEAFDVDVAAVSALALPGYLVLLVLAAAFTLAGLGSVLEVGTVGFSLLVAGWSYLVALGTVGVGRAIARRLRHL